MKYVYMLGIDNDDWTVQDTKVCKKYDIKVKGYYEIGGIEGMVLVGELENLEDLMEMYFGLEIAEDYLCLEDEFDYEDGKWISGSWKEFKKSCGKSLKERSEENEIIVSELQDTVEYFCGLYEEDKELKGRALESLKNAVERLEVFNAIGSIYQWGVEVLNKCGIKYKGLKESKKSIRKSLKESAKPINENNVAKFVDELNKWVDKTINYVDGMEFANKYGKLYSFDYVVDSDGTIRVFDEEGTLDWWDGSRVVEFIKNRANGYGWYAEACSGDSDFCFGEL